MPLIPRPTHIETEDPKFFELQKDTRNQFIAWGILTFIAGLLLGIPGLAVSLAVLGYLLVTLLLKIYHKLQVEQVQHYWQTEALFSLYNTLEITHPLPPMRLWAASPDFVTIAVALIREHQPEKIVEIGSGVSTLVSAYALKANGSGQLISLEHQATFTEVTAANLRSHQLESIARVNHAPLRDLSINQTNYLWYDSEALQGLPDRIDLLVVDGPPSGTASMARYPALPMLFDRIQAGGYILVDDFMRDDEYKMVNRWLEEFDLSIIRTFANEKGAAILRKNGE